jgi:hypothetical protein
VVARGPPAAGRDQVIAGSPAGSTSAPSWLPSCSARLMRGLRVTAAVAKARLGPIFEGDGSVEVAALLGRVLPGG